MRYGISDFPTTRVLLETPIDERWATKGWRQKQYPKAGDFSNEGTIYIYTMKFAYMVLYAEDGSSHIISIKSFATNTNSTARRMLNST